MFVIKARPEHILGSWIALEVICKAPYYQNVFRQLLNGKYFL